MSKLFEDNFGMYISHEKFINKCYKSTNDCISYRLNPDLFKIFGQYKRSKMKSKIKSRIEQEEKNTNEEQNEVKLNFYSFIQNKFMIALFDNNDHQCDNTNNQAMQTVEYIQKNSPNSSLDLAGGNVGPAVVKEIRNSKYLFPEDSTFYAKDVFEMNKYLANRKFDLILLDPPWWNKYIRRKRKASSDAYNMMYNHDLKRLPIDSLLAEDGLLAVWCTNSEQNYNALLNDIFPHWNVNFAAKWYWVKITTSGEPVCNFSEPPGKQPYEKLIFAYRKRSLPVPSDGKLLVSIPSAIHSHKPPLADVLKEFLPSNPECLEIFARYLLPNWTSYGNEVLKLQHESLFV